MYLPGLSKLGSKELGLSQFQHPKRVKNDYSEKIDRFSIWVCTTALEAVIHNKELWKSGYNNKENMLFNADDYSNGFVNQRTY